MSARSTASIRARRKAGRVRRSRSPTILDVRSWQITCETCLLRRLLSQRAASLRRSRLERVVAGLARVDRRQLLPPVAHADGRQVIPLALRAVAGYVENSVTAAMQLDVLDMRRG